MNDARVLTLVLAGGEGSRLEVLTERRAKPAMAYAGSFRLIDIPLSNALHSGLSDVWIVEQYRPHSLNEQLANGRPWDLDRTHGGLRVLPPYEGGDKDGFAQGNADAIYRHLRLIREFGADLILVLSADHIYRLDYSNVIRHHLQEEADLTMVTTEVPREEASRFGVVKVDKKGRVTDFEYKPDEAEHGLITTEIFVYEAEVLFDALEALADEESEGPALEDYGDELLPHLVENVRVAAYHHDGYWRDVGTVESYWRGHMDLLDETPDISFDHADWPILTQVPQRLPARIREGARIADSLIAPGADVAGRVERSVLGPGVVVEEGALVHGAVVLHDTRIRKGARVENALIDRNVTIGAEACVGAQPSGGETPDLALVGMEVEIPDGEQVEAGARIAPPEES